MRTQNRFERIEVEPVYDDIDPADAEFQRSKKHTQFYVDQSKSIVSENDSPDVNFRFSVNPYRGCEHGCSYCYARPYHEYLGLSAGIDFESQIFVKENAPLLLREWLSRKNWEPEPISFSGITDPYQPIERKLELTRECLQVAKEFRQPIYIVTKNRMVARDVDILSEMAKLNLVRVAISVTSLDPSLVKIMEPRTSTPDARLEAIQTLTGAGIPVAVLLAPVIPGINDLEIPKIIQKVAGVRARYVSYVLLRLPMAVEPIFLDWLREHFPDRADKVVQTIREIRDGKLNQSQFGERMRGKGPIAEHIRQTFKVFCKKYGVDQPMGPVDCSQFRIPGQDEQLKLF